MMMSRLSGWFSAPVLGLLALTLLSEDSPAQVITGTVQDSASAALIIGALVSQVRNADVIERAVTDGSGRFQLRLTGTPPHELLIEQLGYTPARIKLDSANLRGGLLEVKLVAKALVLPELDVTANRERLQFTLGVYHVTEDGLYFARNMSRGCFFLALDSVVLRDPRLFLPEARNYSPARLFLDERRGLLSGARGFPSKEEIPDPRLRRDATPCNVGTLVHGPDHDFLRMQGRRVDLPKRELPAPDAPLHDLVPSREFKLAPSFYQHSLGPAAAAPDGRLAIASRASPIIQIVNPDSSTAVSLNLASSTLGVRTISHLGWLADTLWIVDASQHRAMLLPPAGDPIIRNAPTQNPIPATTQNAEANQLDPDFAARLPLPRGQWLIQRPAAAAPFPPRMQDEPMRRAIATMSADGAQQRTLAVLRPGPWRLSIGILDAPNEPFRDHPLYEISPDGDHVTIVQRSFEAAVWLGIYTIVRIDLQGDTIFRVERRAPMIEISDEVFRAAAAEIATHPAVIKTFPQGPLLQALAAKTIYRPRFHPPITALVVGRDGTTWLRWPDERKRTIRWDVVDARGKPLRTVTVDRRLQIIGADRDAAWGLVHDENGATLVHYRLRSRN